MRSLAALLFVAASIHSPAASRDDPSRDADAAGYRTVQTARRAAIAQQPSAAVVAAGFLGAAFETDSRGRVLVAEVIEGSPADKAGLLKGDLLVRLGDKSVRGLDGVKSAVKSSLPGATLKLGIERGRKRLEVAAIVGAVSRPLRAGADRAILGVRMSAASDAAGIAITSVTDGRPASQAGLKPGDVILSVNDAALGEALSLTDKLSEYRPGDAVKLRVRRGREEMTREVVLAADDTGSIPPEERRTLSPWKKDVYRLAVLLVEFPDTMHNPQIGVRDWENAYFSGGTYTGTNATGQKVYGSMADYYREISCGKLRVEGRVFDWVQAPKNRGDYNTGRTGTTRSGLFSNVVASVLARDGADALGGFDGLAVIYAGDRFPGANRGSILWAHRSSVNIRGKLWPYVIVPEGGRRMNSISVMCHETGHILGLPDLYARPENPGSEGAGTWCAMSNQSPNGRPQHFSAWCKEQLGWLTPTVIDPTVKQKLVLGPVEGSTNECFKVLVRPDGSEYLLLENRRRKGFDASLAAEGLLIWRVVANRPILEESHGIDGPIGPRVFLTSVPYPSKANESFTPYTTPSSRSQLGGGLPVHLHNIRQLPDGRVAFWIGYEFD